MFNNIKSDKKREKIKKKITNNLGEVEESFFELICHINLKKIKISKDGCYIINCFGIDSNKELAKKYDLYKPITYVIDGFNIDKRKLYINGYDNCKVFIKKSNFSNVLVINNPLECIIEDTTINAYSYLSLASKELVLNNVSIKNKFKCEDLKISIALYSTNNLKILNSSIGDCNCNVFLKSNNYINLINSNLNGINTKIDTNILFTDDKSKILAINNVDIKDIFHNKIITNSKYLIVNGKIVKKNEDERFLNTLIDPLKDKRYELYTLLVKLRDECNKNNEIKIKRYKSELENSNITKVIKKNK